MIFLILLTVLSVQATPKHIHTKSPSPRTNQVSQEKRFAENIDIKLLKADLKKVPSEFKSIKSEFHNLEVAFQKILDNYVQAKQNKEKVSALLRVKIKLLSLLPLSLQNDERKLIESIKKEIADLASDISARAIFVNYLAGQASKIENNTNENLVPIKDAVSDFYSWLAGVPKKKIESVNNQLNNQKLSQYK